MSIIDCVFFASASSSGRFLSKSVQTFSKEFPSMQSWKRNGNPNSLLILDELPQTFGTGMPFSDKAFIVRIVCLC